MSRPRTMRAAVLHGKEDLRIERVDVPRPGPGEVLLRAKAALTCGTDLKVYRRGYHARMIVPPAVFGHEVAGVVEEVGAGVEEFTPGMAVVAANSAPCGECGFCRDARPSLCDDLLFWNGAYAEFVLIPARVARVNLLPLPPGVSFPVAAMVEPLACVLRGVEDCGIRAGQHVAVIGAGAIGQLFLKLARDRGARVVLAGRNRDRLERARSQGAADVVESGPDLAAALRRASPDGRGHDVVVEAVGLPETCEAAVAAARKGGLINLFGGCVAGAEVRLDAQRLHYEELTLKATFHHTPDSVRAAMALIAGGSLDPGVFLTGEAPLERLPEVLADMARGTTGLKTVIVP